MLDSKRFWYWIHLTYFLFMNKLPFLFICIEAISNLFRRCGATSFCIFQKFSTFYIDIFSIRLNTFQAEIEKIRLHNISTIYIPIFIYSNTHNFSIRGLSWNNGIFVLKFSFDISRRVFLTIHFFQILEFCNTIACSISRRVSSQATIICSVCLFTARFP